MSPVSDTRIAGRPDSHRAAHELLDRARVRGVEPLRLGPALCASAGMPSPSPFRNAITRVGLLHLLARSVAEASTSLTCSAVAERVRPFEQPASRSLSRFIRASARGAAAQHQERAERERARADERRDQRDLAVVIVEFGSANRSTTSPKPISGTTAPRK
jgi:hypothetical protein